MLDFQGHIDEPDEFVLWHRLGWLLVRLHLSEDIDE
jgi:hypothetical protein